MKNIKDFSLEEMESFIARLGKERYRARQIVKWLYRRGTSSFDEMTDLAKDLRTELSRTSRISSLELLKLERSGDGTRKYLFELEDGNQIESVLIPDGGRLTLCISTQVGCAMGCRFCLTGMSGFARDLTSGEILNQLLGAINELDTDGRITNCVLMGMGEPLANYDRVKKALEIMASDVGFGFSRRRITLSTVGIIPTMKKLFAEKVPCRLAISLNATTQKVRAYLMPISKRYPLSTLLASCRDLSLPPRERITFEYVLIKGIINLKGEPKNLPKILSGIRAKVK